MKLLARGFLGLLAALGAVAGKNFDHFVPPGFERAYLGAKGELPD